MVGSRSRFSTRMTNRMAETGPRSHFIEGKLLPEPLRLNQFSQSDNDGFTLRSLRHISFLCDEELDRGYDRRHSARRFFASVSRSSENKTRHLRKFLAQRNPTRCDRKMITAPWPDHALFGRSTRQIGRQFFEAQRDLMRTLMFARHFFFAGILFLVLASAGYAQQHSADCWLENKSPYRVSTNFFGTQPSTTDIRSYMQTLAVQYTVPIEVIAVVCYKESTLFQYNASAGSVGFLIHNQPECKTAYSNSSAPVPPGLGLMQLTGATASDPSLVNNDVLKQITDWRYNLEAGVQVLVKKYKAAISGDPTCLVNLRSQTNSQKVLENWYYAIQFYNGSNAASVTYRDDAYAKIANPPNAIAGWFPPANITRPELVIPNFSSGTQGFYAGANGVWTNYQCSTYSGSVHISSSFGSATAADLALESVAVTQVNPIPGGSISIRTVTNNIGGVTSPSYTISYYASTDTQITSGDYLIGTSTTIAGLPSGQRATTDVTGNLPSNLPSGFYYIGAILNISDANTSNNIGYDPTRITVGSQTGSLQVTINPSGAVSAGAQWQVDGGSYQNSGATVSGLLAGQQHTLAFKTINGWATPSSQTVTISANQTFQTSGTYTATQGYLQTMILPQNAINAGAQWQVPGSGWLNTGDTVGLSPGTFTVSFKPISGWITPTDRQVQVTAGQTAVTTGIYSTQTRVIGLSGNLAFGNVTVGTSSQRTLTISNSGNSTLTVTSISYPTGFSGNWSGGTIAPNGGSRDVTLTFSPTAAVTYGGQVTVSSDATNGGGNVISASGTGTNGGTVATLLAPAANAAVIFPQTFSWTLNNNSSVKLYLAAVANPFVTGDNIAISTETFSGNGSLSITPQRWANFVGFLGVTTTYYWTVGPSDTSLNTAYASWQPFSVATLTNISTRGFVQTNDNIMIGGFIVSGPSGSTKRVMIRGLGPSLNVQGVPIPGRMTDPLLELHMPDGTTIITNDNWRDAANANEVPSDKQPTDDRESVLIVTLPANVIPYTVFLRGAHAETGVGLVEVYDIDSTSNATLTNISTRGFVQTNDNIMIGGFIVSGPSGSTKRVMIRGLGPSLNVQGVPIPGRMTDPLLELHMPDKSIVTNDNWRDAANANEVPTAKQPTDDRESVIIITLPSNVLPYTVFLKGAHAETGVGLVEVYSLDN